MVVCDLGERDLLITFTALLIVLVLVLAKLTAAICAKTVKMAAVRQCHSVSLATRDSQDFLVAQGLDSRWIRLIRLILCVLWQISDVIKTELSKCCLAPSVNVSFLSQGHRVGISTSKLCDHESVQTLNLFGNWHERTPVDIEWHLKDVSEA